MPQKKDYYRILEVEKSASQEDVKKAYRKLVKEWHPDRHMEDKQIAEEKFKEIQEAYEVLSNPEKRKLYDRFGFVPEGGMPNGGTRGGTGGFEDIFGDIFGGFGGNQSSQGGPFSDIFDMFFGSERNTSGGRRRGNPPQRGDDIHVNLSFELKDILYDSKKIIEYTRTSECHSCKGTGAKNGTAFKTCPRCNGTGQHQEEQRTLFGSFIRTSVCPTCSGEGKIIEEKCSDCSGTGKISSKERIEVTIPAGIEDGAILRYREKGNAGKFGGPSGDLLMHLRVNPDKRFIRKGSDLETEIKINYITAALGGEIQIPTLEGNITESISEATNPDTVIRLKNQGLPSYNGRKRGDIYVKINVEFNKPSIKERKLLKEIAKIKNLSDIS